LNVICACTRDCYDACSLIIRVRDNAIVGIDGNKSHPITQGVICPRIRAFSKKVQSDLRIGTPLRRIGERGSGQFTAITWDDALKEISDRIKTATRESGSSSIGLYDTHANTGTLSRYFPLRFMNAINGSISADTICSAAGDAALEYNFGSQNGYPAEKIPEARLIVLWGINSKWTNMHGAQLVQKAKKKGASVWVIDPIRTPTAEMGRHLQIRPGTDAALALTMINHIVENNMHDQEFLQRFTIGFENLVEVARKYDINRGSEITGLRPSDIAELSTEFVSLRPCVIQIGLGLQRQRNGGEMVRTISLIPSIIGQHRGFIYTNDATDFDMDYLTAADLRTVPDSSFNVLELPRLIEEERLRVLLVINSNPLATLPNQNALRKALSSSDAFIVTHDLFMTDTADWSDIVLPATSMFEHLDLVSSYFHDYVNLNEPAATPWEESRSNVELFKSLAKSLGLRQKELYEDQKTIISNIVKKSRRIDSDMQALRRRGFAKMSPLPLDVYQTPSGKIEIYSRSAEEDGLPSVPDHVPLKGTHPYQLLSPCTFEMNHSSTHLLFKDDIAQRILISPEDSKTLGLMDQSKVTIENQTGSLTLPVEISDRIPVGVVVVYTGFWPKLCDEGKNINFITSDYIQRFGGNSAYHTTFVRIVR